MQQQWVGAERVKNNLDNKTWFPNHVYKGTRRGQKVSELTKGLNPKQIEVVFDMPFAKTGLVLEDCPNVNGGHFKGVILQDPWDKLPGVRYEDFRVSMTGWDDTKMLAGTQLREKQPADVFNYFQKPSGGEDVVQKQLRLSRRTVEDVWAMIADAKKEEEAPKVDTPEREVTRPSLCSAVSVAGSRGTKSSVGSIRGKAPAATPPRGTMPPPAGFSLASPSPLSSQRTSVTVGSGNDEEIDVGLFAGQCSGT